MSKTRKLQPPTPPQSNNPQLSKQSKLIKKQKPRKKEQKANDIYDLGADFPSLYMVSLDNTEEIVTTNSLPVAQPSKVA